VKPWLLFVMVLAGCAGVAQQNRLNQFEKIENAYGVAIRWSDFERAVEVAGIEGDQARLSPRLREVKVISYETQIADASSDLNQIQRTAEIEYSFAGSIRVHRIRDRQIWRYDEPRQRWVLSSGLPRFTDRD
jgi:hypothetical protein